MDQRYDKWKTWIDPIFKETQGVLIQRHIFVEVQGIIQANQDIRETPSSFWEFLRNGYVTLATMAVRRQIKIQNQSVSLARLLGELADTPEVFSRKRFKEEHPGSWGADRFFDKFSGEGALHIDPVPVKKDLSDLKSIARDLEAFADQRIAHLDKRTLAGSPVTVTFDELDQCLNTLEELTLKYYRLFTAHSISDILPAWQYDWTAIFEIPWVTDLNRTRIARSAFVIKRPS